MEEASEIEDPLVTDGSLLYMYETATRFRKMAMPNSTKSYSTYQERYGSYEDYYSTKPVYHHPLEDIYYSARDATIPIYDDIKMHKSKPGNFGLSNYGHLKIDYSCSWNSLGRYIGK